MNTIEDRIAELSVSRLGFPVRRVIHLMEWKGYDVYYVEYDLETPPCIGQPIFYLVKGDCITVSSTEEAFEILDLIPSDEDEDEEDPFNDSQRERVL